MWDLLGDLETMSPVSQGIPAPMPGAMRRNVSSGSPAVAAVRERWQGTAAVSLYKLNLNDQKDLVNLRFECEFT